MSTLNSSSAPAPSARLEHSGFMWFEIDRIQKTRRAVSEETVQQLLERHRACTPEVARGTLQAYALSASPLDLNGKWYVAEPSGRAPISDSLVIAALVEVRQHCDVMGWDYGKLDRAAYQEYLTMKRSGSQANPAAASVGCPDGESAPPSGQPFDGLEEALVKVIEHALGEIFGLHFESPEPASKRQPARGPGSATGGMRVLAVPSERFARRLMSAHHYAVARWCWDDVVVLRELLLASQHAEDEEFDVRGFIDRAAQRFDRTDPYAPGQIWHGRPLPK